MPAERLTFDLAPSAMFTDGQSRTIAGLAVPTGATAEKGGRTWKFLKGSVQFGSRTPLLAYHDPTRPVGLLKGSQWTDAGLRVTFSVSKTPAGDECLQLA